jgi:exopolysaccharide production protein ExoQ
LNAGLSKPASSNLEKVEVDSVAFAVGFYLSFRLIIVLFSVRVLGLEPSTGTALSLGLDVALLGLVSFNRVGNAHASFRSMLRFSALRWVLAFLAVSVCSLAWSETSSLPNSAAYWLGLAVDVANITLLVRGVSVASVSHSLMKGFICSTCLLALVAWIMPAQADLRLGEEQFFNANEIGNLCAFTIFFAQYLMRRRDGKWGLVTFFLLVTLVRSLSKTTLVAFFLSEGFLVVQDRSISRRSKILITITMLLLGLIFWGLFEAYYDVYTTAGNQAETLTGRTAIWLYVLGALRDHPWSLWIGHGFDAWWKVVPPFGDNFEARHAENELLQQLYAYGVVGILLLGGLYGSLYRQVRRLSRSPMKVLFLSILLFIVVRGLAEADAFDLLLPLWSIVLIAVLADHEQKTSSAYAGPRPPEMASSLGLSKRA